MRNNSRGGRALLGLALMAFGLILNGASRADDHKLPERMHMTSMFSGKEVHVGTVMHTQDGKNHMLTWSDEFKIPNSPAPHWQVVDSKGNVFLLNRLKIKDDKLNRTIVLPSYGANVGPGPVNV